MLTRYLVPLVIIGLEYGAIVLTLPDRYNQHLPLYALGIALGTSLLYIAASRLAFKVARNVNVNLSVILIYWGGFLAQLGFIGGLYIECWAMAAAVLTPLAAQALFYIGRWQILRRRRLHRI